MISLALSLMLAADADFWTWFQKNEERLVKDAKANPVETMEEIQKELAESNDDGLIVELMLGQKPTLIISADGDTTKFPAVKRVVAAAPKTLKKWQVTAFRPRHEVMVGGDLEVEGKKYPTKDFFFRVVGGGKTKVNIEIAIRGRTEESSKEYDQAAFMLLDGVVGEYDAETKVGGIAFSALPKKPDASYRPLTELAKVVDSLPAQ